MTTMTTEFLSVTEAGRRLGVTTEEVLRRVLDETLPAAKRAGRIVIPVSALPVPD